MGAATRRPESEAMAKALSAYRPLHWLSPPATLDGGDVLRIGKTLYVGQTPRTNAAAVDQLCQSLAPRGYRVVPVPISRCLHLKSACARLDDATVLVNPLWIDPAVFAGLTLVSVADSEPWGANAVRAGKTVIFPDSEPNTRATVGRSGFLTASVDVSEMQKAEAGVTCLSLVFDA
jgi:dimethylargininase